MKLYRTGYTDDELSSDKMRTIEHLRGNWQGTQASALEMRKSLKQEGMREIVTVEIDVPTDKAGLIGWLNAYETAQVVRG